MKKILSVALATAVCAGCVNPNLLAQQGRARQQTTEPTYIEPVSAGPAKNRCWLHLAPKGMSPGMLLSGGQVEGNRFAPCAPGGSVSFGPAEAHFVANLIPVLCDTSKPVTQTPMRLQTLQVLCTYQGPAQVPASFEGVPITVIR